MKYLIDICDLEEYQEVTADTFHQEQQFIVFFNFFRELGGRVVEGAVTKLAAYPVEKINHIIGEADED